MTETTLLAEGWCSLPGFIGGADLEKCRALVDEAFGRTATRCMDRRGNDLLPLRWNDPIIQLLLESPSRLEQLRGVLGQDIRWISGYVTSKAASTPALWWHQDWWCWDHEVSFGRTPPQVAVLCYLDDTDETNGALRVLPRSHRSRGPLHDSLPDPHSEEADTLPLDHPAMTDAAGQVSLRLKAGDTVLLDYRLLHGTHPNTTSHRRDAVLLSFVPSWTTLSKDVCGHLISHPALPTIEESEAARKCMGELLPKFSGAPKDLCVNRSANPPKNTASGPLSEPLV